MTVAEDKLSDQVLALLATAPRGRAIEAIHRACTLYGVSHLSPYLTTIEAAELCAVSVDTMEKWRAANVGPPWRKLERTKYGRGGKDQLRLIPRYRRDELLAWIESTRVESAPVKRPRVRRPPS